MKGRAFRRATPLVAVRQTVLVVEDEPDHRAVTRMTLRLSGYDVCEAGTGEDALARLDELRPDALVLDIRLPGIDGLEVLAHLRSERARDDVAVVLCSAHTDCRAPPTRPRRSANELRGQAVPPRPLIAALDTCSGPPNRRQHMTVDTARVSGLPGRRAS